MGRNIAGSHVLWVFSILFLHYSECLHGIQNKILGWKFFLVSGTWKVTYGIVHEHACWQHTKWTCLAKDLVFWNEYDAVIIPELSWLCWENKGIGKPCIPKCIIVWSWAWILTSNFFCLWDCDLFHGGISAFRLWAVLEKSSLATVHCVFFCKVRLFQETFCKMYKKFIFLLFRNN